MKRRTAGRLLAWVMTVAMLLSLVVIPVAADETDTSGDFPTSGTIDSGTYTLTEDVTLAGVLTIDSGSDVTIDLNGHSISYTSADSALYYMITNNGTLTITDSAGGGEISLTATKAGNSASVIGNSGNVYLYGGTIKATSTVKSLCGVKEISGDPTVTLNGGNIEITIPSGNKTGLTAYGINNAKKTNSDTIDIISGTISVTDYQGNAMAVFVDCNNSVLTMTGGTLYAYAAGSNADASIATGIQVSQATVTGGTITATSVYATANGILCGMNKGNEISGVTVTVTTEDSSKIATAVRNATTISSGEYVGRITRSAGSTLATTITGGTFSVNVSEYVDGDDAIQTLTAEDGSTLYRVIGDNVAEVTSGETSTMYETLKEAMAAAADGDTVTLLKNVTITDATYNSDGCFQVSGIEVTLDLGGYTLSVDTTRILGVKNGGKLNVENGKVEIASGTSATYNQFNMVRGDSTFTATDVTFEANSIGGYAVYIASGATATVKMTNCTFKDLANAVVFDADNASTVTLTGCTYDKQPFSTSTFSTVNNYTVVITGNSDMSSGYEANRNYALFFNYVVANGGTLETSSTVSLSSYFGNSSLTVEDGGTVNANVKVNDNTSMTVEGGTVTGTITVAKEGATEEVAAVSEEDSSEEASEYEITGGLLTISGGTVTGQIKSSGTLIMTGGEVKDDGETGYSDGVIYILNGNVYVSGGTVTGTKRGFGFAGSGTIDGTITGGSFTGSDIALMVRANASNTVKISGGSYTATNALYLSQDGMIADDYGTYNTEGSVVSYTMSGSVYLYKSSLSDKTVVVGPTNVMLGVSSDNTKTVSAEITSGYGTDTMYVKVKAANMGSYSTDAYPTTNLTFTDEDGKEHSYIFAGWYEDSTGTTACTSVPSSADGYAKFVDADTLRVLCVYTPFSLSATRKDALRFLTSLDSLDCLAGGFVVNGTTCSCTGYAESCTVSNSSLARKFTKSDISVYANYLLTYRIYEDTLADNYSVYAYWTTADGTTVSGEVLTFSSSSLTGATVLGENAES